ncbi:MAG: ATPase domain-containing protein [Candidatus Diapherotrites archaeon]
MIQRIPTGVTGFDNLIQGGWPKGSTVLVSGAPGTGKSIFCMNALYNNSLKGKKCLYISFEQTAEDIKEQMKQFGWTKVNNHLTILSVGADDLALADTIVKAVKKEKPDMVVVDSVASIFGSTPQSGKSFGMKQISEMVYPSVVDESTITRSLIRSIILGVRATGATSFFISEIMKDSPTYSRDTISEFLCDGIIMLSAYNALDTRKLEIAKLRNTKHTLKQQTFKITSKGIAIE